jgi:molybdopterin-containing oxidoreductase family iron-sulfur binding subunit
MPGQAAGSITVALGYGRRVAGPGEGVGTNAYPLRTADALHWASVTATALDAHRVLATTQNHYAIDPLGARESDERSVTLAREQDFAAWAEQAHAAHAAHEAPLFEPWSYTGHKWGMAIDLNACVGCNACIVACQSENNIPVVGKDEVARGREMHWIRVDRYFSGPPEAPAVAHQPLTCHHCETAPCEQVCPVAATVHDHEGLNVMVYNRCVGTRYCANNCPYKVRRFNYFNNHRGEGPLEQMKHNPDVSVRSRGVMEKCSFCIQRINRVRIAAKAEGRPIADGEVVPACAQACPTRAIVFGDLNDPASAVHALHADGRAYGLLDWLDLRPRTRYLTRLRNRAGAGGSGGPA